MLLDNGRTRALADEVGRQALRCIRCSACLNVCPVYERTGGHAYGSVYPGPIGAILNPLLQGRRRRRADRLAALRLHACAAPASRSARSRIDIPSVLVDLRAQVVDAHRGGRARRPGGGRDEGRRAGRSATPPAGAGRARRRAVRPGRSAARPATLPGGRRRSAGCRGPGRRGPAPATCPAPPARVVPGLVEAHRTAARRRDVSAREEILAAVRAALATARSRRRSRCRPRVPRGDRPVRCRRCSTCSPSGSPTTARRSSRCRTDEVASRPSPRRCRRRPRRRTGRPADGLAAGRAPAPAVDTGLTRAPSSTRSTPWSPTAAVGIAETGTIVLDHGPGQGRRALTLVPDLHVCVVRADQVVPDVPDAVAAARPGPPADLDQRAVGHQRHRARPGRGRARPAHPARHPGRRLAHAVGSDGARRPARAGLTGRQSGHITRVRPQAPAREHGSEDMWVFLSGRLRRWMLMTVLVPMVGFGARKLGEAIEGIGAPTPSRPGCARRPRSSAAVAGPAVAGADPHPAESASRMVPGRAPGVPAQDTGTGARAGAPGRAAGTWPQERWRIVVVDVMRLVMRAGGALHLPVYRASGGRLMGRTSGMPVLLLTVAGRTTGTPHTTPLVYLDSGGRYVVTGSAGWARRSSRSGSATCARPTGPSSRWAGSGPRSRCRSPHPRNVSCCGSSWWSSHPDSAATRPRRGGSSRWRSSPPSAAGAPRRPESGDLPVFGPNPGGLTGRPRWAGPAMHELAIAQSVVAAVHRAHRRAAGRRRAAAGRPALRRRPGRPAVLLRARHRRDPARGRRARDRGATAGRTAGPAARTSR